MTSTGSPARRATDAALRRQTSSTPLPTVPNPKIAILAIFFLLPCYAPQAPRCTSTTKGWRARRSSISSTVICIMPVRTVTSTWAVPFSRPRLGDGDNGRPGRRNAGQKPLQRAGLVQQRGNDRNGLAAALGIKNIIFVFIERAAGDPGLAGRQRNVADRTGGQQLLGLQHLQKHIGQHFGVHQQKRRSAIVVSLPKTFVFATRIMIAQGRRCCKSCTEFFSCFWLFCTGRSRVCSALIRLNHGKGGVFLSVKHVRPRATLCPGAELLLYTGAAAFPLRQPGRQRSAAQAGWLPAPAGHTGRSPSLKSAPVRSSGMLSAV